MAKSARRIGYPETEEYRQLYSFYRRLDARRRRLQAVAAVVALLLPLAFGAVQALAHGRHLASAIVNERPM